jgi:hypothetical protein
VSADHRKPGHFRILELLDSGIGEVCLADDTKRGRQVALKALPQDLVADGRNRFHD